MSKNKNKPVSKQSAGNITDKLVEQTATLIISFIFNIALIAACAYILFQYPNDKNAIAQKIQETNEISIKANNFIDMLDIATHGWLYDDAEKARMGEISATMHDNIDVDELDPKFISESQKWIGDAMVKASSERGEINGYHVIGELENKAQQNFVNEYSVRIDILMKTSELLTNWSKETADERKKNFDPIATLYVNSVSDITELDSNVAQAKFENDLLTKSQEQKFNEIGTQKYVADLKAWLSGIGIFISIIIFYVLGKAVIRKAK